MRTLLVLGILLSGCSDEASFSAEEIRAEMPSGTIGGVDWAAVSSVVDVSDDRLSVSLYPTEVEACSFGGGDGGSILFSVPRMAGEYPLRFESFEDSQTITLSPGPGENLIATEGLLVVEALSETEVTIGFIAQFEDDVVNGRFTSTICADDF